MLDVSNVDVASHEVFVTEGGTTHVRYSSDGAGLLFVREMEMIDYGDDNTKLTSEISSESKRGKKKPPEIFVQSFIVDPLDEFERDVESNSDIYKVMYIYIFR